MQIRTEFDFRYNGVSYYSSKFIYGKCGAIYGIKPEHSNDKYHKDILLCRNRFKKGIYCKNARIDNANMDSIICRIAIVAIKKKRYVLDLCKKLLRECGVTEQNAMVDAFNSFIYSAIEEMSIIINHSVVLPDGRADVFMLDEIHHKIKVGVGVKKNIKSFSLEHLKNER